MASVKLITKVEHRISNHDRLYIAEGNFHSNDEIIIPAGAKGEIIDVIIENGKVSFNLVFDDVGIFEWYDVDELEEKFE